MDIYIIIYTSNTLTYLVASFIRVKPHRNKRIIVVETSKGNK